MKTVYIRVRRTVTACKGNTRQIDVLGGRSSNYLGHDIMKIVYVRRKEIQKATVCRGNAREIDAQRIKE